MSRRALISWLFPALACFLWIVAGAGLSEAQGSAFSVRHFQEDRGSPLSIEEVCCSDAVRTWSAPSPNVRSGIGGPPIWIELPSLRPGAVLEITQIVDQAELFEATPAGGWRRSVTGDSVALGGQGLPTARMAFLLSEDLPQETRRYLRVTQPNLSAIGLKVWDVSAFQADVERRRLVQSLLLGFIGAIILYNLIVALIARDQVFGWNAGVIVCIVGIDLYLTGVGARYIWPVSVSNLALNTALFGTCFVGATFIRNFLNTDPKSDPLLRPLRWIGIAAGMIYLTQLVFPYWASQSALLLAIVCLILYAPYAATRMAMRRDVRAILLLFPLCLAIVPGSLSVLLRTIFDFELGALRPHMLEITLAIEALAFSLALASLLRVHAADAEAARADLLNAQLEAAETFSHLQDRERARIANDLHDSIGHNLVLAKGLLEGGASDEPHPKHDEAAQIIRKTLSSVRRLSHELHPASLQHLGWERAVAALFEPLESVHGIQTDLIQEGGPPPLPERGQTHLYRILQEAISNIIRHSGATHCEAVLSRAGDRFEIGISDNGRGLEAGEAGEFGLGMTSIDERVRALGGSWSRKAESAGGLRLDIDIPLRTEKDLSS